MKPLFFRQPPTSPRHPLHQGGMCPVNSTSELLIVQVLVREPAMSYVPDGNQMESILKVDKWCVSGLKSFIYHWCHIWLQNLTNILIWSCRRGYTNGKQMKNCPVARATDDLRDLPNCWWLLALAFDMGGKVRDDVGDMFRIKMQ